MRRVARCTGPARQHRSSRPKGERTPQSSSVAGRHALKTEMGLAIRFTCAASADSANPAPAGPAGRAVHQGQLDGFFLTQRLRQRFGRPALAGRVPPEYKRELAPG